jgi:hypothetical protein
MWHGWRTGELRTEFRWRDLDEDQRVILEWTSKTCKCGDGKDSSAYNTDKWRDIVMTVMKVTVKHSSRKNRPYTKPTITHTHTHTS